MLTTIPITACLDEYNQAEFITDVDETPEPALIAQMDGFVLLEEMGVFWLYRRRLEHCPPRMELLGVIPTRKDLMDLRELLQRACQETDPLTGPQPVVI